MLSIIYYYLSIEIKYFCKEEFEELVQKLNQLMGDGDVVIGVFKKENKIILELGHEEFMFIKDEKLSNKEFYLEKIVYFLSSAYKSKGNI